MNFKSNYLLYILLVVVCIYILGLFLDFVGMDDAVLAEQSYWLNKLGYVKSKLFSGMGQEWEIRQYHYHKLFIFSGALWACIFGWSLSSLNVMVLLFSFGSAFLFYRILKIHFQTNNFFLFIGLLFYLVNGTLFYYSHEFRPEILVMLFGMLSFYFLNEFNRDNKLRLLILSAFFAGLGACTHLNGLVFIFSGVVTLGFLKYYKGAILFGFIGGLTSLLYFADIHSLNEFHMLKAQLLADPNIEEEDSSLLTPILKILNEHQRLFRSPKEITLYASYFIMLIASFKYLLRKHALVLIYSFASIIGLAGLAHGITTKYSLIYYPSVVLLILIAFYHINQSENKILKLSAKGLLFVYFFTQSIYIFNYLGNHDNYYERSELVENYVEDNDRLLATETLVFDFLKTNDFISFLGYRYNRFNYQLLMPEQIEREDIFSFAKEWDCNLIVIDKKLEDTRVLSILDPSSLIENKTYGGFQVLLNTNSILIMRYIE